MPTTGKRTPGRGANEERPVRASAEAATEAGRWAARLQAGEDPDLPDFVTQSGDRRTRRLEFPDGSAIVAAAAGWDWAPHATRLAEAADVLARYRPAGTEGLSREQVRDRARAEAPFLWCRAYFESARDRLWLPKAGESPEKPTGAPAG